MMTNSFACLNFYGPKCRMLVLQAVTSLYLVISPFDISRYADNMEGLFKSLALQHMPTNMQNIDRKKSGKLVGS